MGTRRNYQAQGTVLDRTVLGEHDLILTVLLESGEQLRAVAKGVRRATSSLAARCDFFCDSDFTISAGKKLDVIGAATTIDAHRGLSSSPEKIAAASAVCELAALTSFEESPDPFLHPLLARTLSALEEAKDQAHVDLCVAAYAFKVLAHGGWRPELGTCALCGDGKPSAFSLTTGGLVCSSCMPTVPDAEPISPSQVGWLRSLISLRFDDLLAAPIDDGTALYLLGMAHAWAASALSMRLKAFEFALSL